MEAPLKILIFGGGGFIGGRLAKLAASRAFKTALAGPSVKPGFEEFEFFPTDIADSTQVKRAVACFKPDAIVNAAALSDIDRAENNKTLATAVNVDGARNIAAASAASGARCVSISTDAVFDGLDSTYHESSVPRPVNHYGLSKFEGEKAIATVCPNAVIARVSLVLGLPISGGNSALAKLQRNLMTGLPSPCPADEIRTPIDVLTLSESLLELCQNKLTGLIHLGSTESIDRYTMGKRLALLLGQPEHLIVPRASYGNSDLLKARRHKNGILCVARARANLKTSMPDFETVLLRCLR